MSDHKGLGKTRRQRTDQLSHDKPTLCLLTNLAVNPDDYRCILSAVTFSCLFIVTCDVTILPSGSDCARRDGFDGSDRRTMISADVRPLTEYFRCKITCHPRKSDEWL